MHDATRFEVLGRACIRCAGCATIAPGLFRVESDGAHLRRQPAGDEERGLARAAAWSCPTGAIVGRVEMAADHAPTDETPETPENREAPQTNTDVLSDSICISASLQAEAVRWQMSALPLDEIDRALVSPALVRLVREIALSELTTFTATRRFLQEFSDDADLSQWMAVWLYEETRHPQAMMRWLARLGERLDDKEILKARMTAPFMKSRVGTLAMNVISEVLAAARYLSFARTVREPVMQRIARQLAADEARHGATFFLYARRRIAESPDIEVARLDALKVLYFWLFESAEVQHPVNLFKSKAGDDEAVEAPAEHMRLDVPHVQRRVCMLIGYLVGMRIDEPDAVMPALRVLAARARRPLGSWDAGGVRGNEPFEDDRQREKGGGNGAT